jgi:hypothetical protein
MLRKRVTPLAVETKGASSIVFTSSSSLSKLSKQDTKEWTFLKGQQQENLTFHYSMGKNYKKYSAPGDEAHFRFLKVNNSSLA